MAMLLTEDNTHAQTHSQQRVMLPQPPEKRRRYSVGWIAPLPLELTAAKAVLDEDYGEMCVHKYIYYGGRIGSHNIVMAVQPRMGTDAASDLAARMREAFRGVEYFLVVGIGGGVPRYGPPGGKSEIVLGDVVVSYPMRSHGGVVRYDFGACTDKGFQIRGYTNSPPDHLLTAVGSLRVRHSTSGTKIPSILQKMRLNIHVDRDPFKDQGAMRDRLFQDDCYHTKQRWSEICEDCCDLSRSQLRNQRGIEAARDTDAPRIHYGNIGSSNQLQISPRTRNQLHEDHGIICFEMEGAGVIQSHPCLVIRGICDYSDSHKNKKWQPYAAATAAAYARELIEFVKESDFAQRSTISEKGKKPDLRWFYHALQQELWELEREFLSCRNLNHTDDEYQLGFVNSSVFQSWLAKPGSSLWCRLKPNTNSIHLIPGACLVRQATAFLSERVYIFWYGCKRESPINLPFQYLQQKQQCYSQDSGKADGKEFIRKQDVAELILLSFLMQAMRQGFRVDLDGIDLSNLQLFIVSLVEAFAGCLESQEGKAILIIDGLHLVHENEQAAVIGALTSIIAHNRLQRCSIVLAAESTPSISLLLKGYPTVQVDSEYQECLQSLYLEDRHVRRGEISEPIRKSNSWIWTHPAMIRLMNCDAGALAVIGKAGSGKSVLAKTIQRRLSKGLVVADWFYCRRKGEFFTTYLPLLRSILYEVLLRERSLFRFFKSVYRRCPPTTARMWSIPELEEVLSCVARASVPLFMIFDALDEAQDANIVPLVESLVCTPHSKMKVIVLSRPIRDLESQFWSSRLIVLQDENGNDIQEVITDGLFRLHRVILGDFGAPEYELLAPVRQHAALRPGSTTTYTVDDTFTLGCSSTHELSKIESLLRERSNGVILWVVLVFDSLYKLVERGVTVTVDELRISIDSYPSEIDSFYTQMVQEISSRLNESGLQKARIALMWINMVSQTKQLTLAELWDGLAVPDDASNGSFDESELHPIISRRVAIRDWKDFYHKLRRMCGSFIEVLPDREARDKGRASPSNFSATSVIQLMHQTVKDFLTKSPGAAELSFSEKEAFQLVSKRCLNYVKIVLPVEQGVFELFRVPRHLHWREYISQVAIYLEEFRLVELCCQILRLAYMQPQAEMTWNGFLHKGLLEWPEVDFFGTADDWVYDLQSSLTIRHISSALGFVFHFSTSQGLVNSIRNLTSLCQLQDEAIFWDIYRDSILNGVLFTVLDNRDHPLYHSIRRKLIFPNKSPGADEAVSSRSLVSQWCMFQGRVPNPASAHIRRESAVLALDHLYDPRRCSELLKLDTRESHSDIENIYHAVEAVLNYVFGGGANESIHEGRRLIADLWEFDSANVI